MRKHLLNLIVLMLMTPPSMLAAAETDWLDNTMYQSGKINVVIAVVGVLVLVLFIYLIALDLRLRRIERESKD